MLLLFLADLATQNQSSLIHPERKVAQFQKCKSPSFSTANISFNRSQKNKNDKELPNLPFYVASSKHNTREVEGAVHMLTDGLETQHYLPCNKIKI
ncbi:hypothetical protein ACROYT_G001375 [Oculina patagonica]